MDNSVPVFLPIVFVILLPFMILMIKDYYFKKLGKTRSEIDVIGVKWLVAPFMLTTSILFLWGGWWYANENSQINSFLFGVVLGLGVGIWSLCKTLSLNKKQLSSTKLKSLRIVYLLIIASLFTRGSQISPAIDSFFDSHSFILSPLFGFFSSFVICSWISSFLLAIRRKVSLLP